MKAVKYPKKRPTPGLVVPVTLHRVRDGDTIEVKIPGSSLIWPIRLIDCWAPETKGSEKELGLRAKDYVEGVLMQGDPLTLQIPTPDDWNVLASLTFDRVPGYLWVGASLLNEMVVKSGHATSTREG